MTAVTRLDRLRERLYRAHERLSDIADDDPRLLGKKEGVRLAIGYLEEEIRLQEEAS